MYISDQGRVVAIRHDKGDVAGSLPELFDELGMQLEVIDVDGVLPEPRELRLLVLLGSPESAYDHRLPWLEKELEWLKRVQADDIPTFGICFGSQILARALGGQVYKNKQAEIGWTDITSVIPAADSGISRIISGPWLNFHFDAFSVPPKARLLGKTNLAPQIFCQGKAMGVQFHPEINVEMYDTWIRYWNETEEGQRFLSTAGELPQRIRHSIAEREDMNKDNCRQLLRLFMHEICCEQPCATELTKITKAMNLEEYYD